MRSADELAGCSGKDPKEDPSTSLFSIDVIEVPVTAPERARIVNQPRIFADAATGALSGLWQGGNHGPGTQASRMTRQCHDITVFPEIGLAAGACAGNGLLLDISDPVHPVRLDAVTDKSFAYWHSATFSLDGSRVIFTDEWGGGTRPRCRSTDPITWGADAVFDVVDRKLRFAGYYKMPAAQSELENCVAHNGSLIPVPGRDIMVQAWYQGGISVFDFSDAAHPVEIAFFDRGPLDARELILGGYWSAYWYNGHIYGSEISRGWMSSRSRRASSCRRTRSRRHGWPVRPISMCSTSDASPGRRALWLRSPTSINSRATGPFNLQARMRSVPRSSAPTGCEMHGNGGRLVSSVSSMHWPLKWTVTRRPRVAATPLASRHWPLRSAVARRSCVDGVGQRSRVKITIYLTNHA